MRQDDPFDWRDARGGQQSALPPHALAAHQVVAAVNVEWHRATLARKRRGTRKPVFTSDANAPSAVSFGTMAYLASSDGSQRVLVEEFTLTSRLHLYNVTSRVWSSGVDLIDTVASYANFVRFYGRVYALYQSAADRIHEVTIPGAMTVVRASLAAPTSAPVATPSAGAVTDTRKYRWVKLRSDGAATVRRSEPSSATSGIALAAQQATVAVSSAVAETENVWELQVATDDDSYASWWVVGSGNIGNTIADNNASIITAGLEPAPELGLYEALPSAKYGVVDQNRLVLASAPDATSLNQSRVWFTPALVNPVDAERYVNTTDRKYHLDVGVGDDNAGITGLAEPTLGSVLVFKRTQTWKLVRTGDLDEPYRAVQLSPSIGCLGHRTIVSGEDELGNPAVYFLSMRGAYRVGARGFEYLSGAISDLWDRVDKELSEYTGQHGVYYAERRQVWWWVSIDSTTDRRVLVFHVDTGAWSQYTGDIGFAYCSMLAPREIGNALDGCSATEWIQSRVPYAYINASQGGAPGGALHECDAINPHLSPTATSEIGLTADGQTYSGTSGVWSSGTPFRAYVQSRPLPLPLWVNGAVTRAVLAGAASTATVTVTLTADYGRHTDTGSVTLAPTSAAESRVTKDVAVGVTGSRAIQATVGDSSAIAQLWTLDALALRVRTEADA